MENNYAPFYFHQGSSRKAFEYMGAHQDGGSFVFRVWAPNADSVSLVGDFNGWEKESLPMSKVTSKGIWEIYTDKPNFGDRYKYFIKNGEKEIYKADPYAFFAEHPPETASILFDIEGFEWRDSGYLNYRKEHFTREKVMSEPMNIYEVHLGSFKRRDGEVISYAELAEELSSYVKQMGYTHIEIMPVSEYPFDGSWGYQVTGYYAPTSRFGNPKDFMAFVNKMHEAGIGVILDWVPAHFPKDAHGLYEFDGQPLYEYQGKDRMEHASWGTRRFDVGREEVQSFLISNTYYWIEKYHIDALRIDAVASMLYLDYDKKPGEWVPNIYGENKCLEAISFFRKLNSAIMEDHPDVMTIAEESTAWPNVTSFWEDGLGFTLKWNMGWMNDTLSYAGEDPLFRKYHHNKINFSLSYAFSEKYVLPISHDEVVHGKKSFLDKMPGDYEMKFAGARAFLTYMIAHPGKKLTFMGSEIGQFREWDFAGEIEWFLLDYDMHRKFQEFSATLFHFYLENPPLFENDGDWIGFEWIDADNGDESVASFRRRDRKGNELVVVFNFTPVERRDFLLTVPFKGTWKEVFNTDKEKFGGSGIENKKPLKSIPHKFKYYNEAIKIDLPPMCALMYKLQKSAPKNKKTEKSASK